MNNKKTISLKTAYAMLFLLSFLWASTTITMKIFISNMAPSHFMLGRFSLAAIIFFAFRYRHIKFNKKMFIHGAYTGFFLFLSYYFSIVALKHTTASKAGFLVALSVLWVPLFQMIITRRMPNRWVVITVLLSLAGLYLISGLDGIGFNYGDFFALLSSLTYTFYIIYIDKYIEEMDGDQMTFMILLVVSVWSLIIAVTLEKFEPITIVNSWQVILVVAVFGTLVTTYFQTKAQSVASPEAVGVILLGEPLFTLIMAVLLLSETVTKSGLVGAVLLLASLVVAVIKKI